MTIRSLLLTCLNILTNYKYNVLGTKTIDIHMSNNESLDEETKRILAEVDSNDSTESKHNKKKYPDKVITIKYDADGYETNDLETADSEW